MHYMEFEMALFCFHSSGCRYSTWKQYVYVRDPSTWI